MLAGVLALELLLFGFTGTNFLSRNNFFEIIRLSVELGLLALVMTPIILTGGIDLSVGSLLGLCAILFGKMWRDGHLPGAVHIPWYDLATHGDELPVDSDIWVHCAAGFRAAIAASLLQRAGRRPILVDDRWWRAYDAGLEVEQAA